ncbi:class II aldolase/adducin family protein [Nocardia sp. alder85J]|uniref:class II aldolase/adducin family protein n=1 Tax=Nocardia sp. alder85J TaxID=2862949 RepID=UPI001CD36EB4|nr:class II aldolase/adducin family protein [Nocardia sp. alder85J]MCX4092062.1 class II aldolase/adducin family protein [Nocardia sp. alder85J]
MSGIAAAERAEVAAACRELAAAGLLIGTAGNVSVRAGELVAVTATGTVLGEMTAEEVTVVDPDGTVVSGRLAPTSELELHLGVYREFPVGAIVHTHAPHSIAVGLVCDELPVIHYQQLPLGGATPVVPFFPFGTPELAAAVRDSLVDRSAALLSNHGAVTVGATLRQAVEHTELLEWACGIYLDAHAIGTPRALSAAQQDAVRAVIARTAYGTTKPV